MFCYKLSDSIIILMYFLSFCYAALFVIILLFVYCCNGIVKKVAFQRTESQVWYYQFTKGKVTE